MSLYFKKPFIDSTKILSPYPEFHEFFRVTFDNSTPYLATILDGKLSINFLVSFLRLIAEIV